MKIPAFLVALLLAAGPALGQPGKKDDWKPRPGQAMSQEDRQRMREDVREAYRARPGQPEKSRPMSPEERDKLRRDIQDASRELRR